MEKRRYANYVVFGGIVALVAGLAINHSRHLRYLIDTLQGPDRGQRIAAARELVQGEQFTDTLMGEPVSTRVAVIGALEDWARQPAPARPAKPDPSVPKVYGPGDAVTTLVSCLKDTDKPVRDRALVGLLRVGSANAENLQALLPGLKDADPNVRRGSVTALQFLGQTRAEEAARILPADIAALAAGSSDGSRAAALLWPTRDPAVCASVPERVVAYMKAEADARPAGGDALGALVDRRDACADLLLAAQAGADDTVRAGMADALGKVGSPRAVAPLVAMAAGKPPVRKAAIGALAAIAAPEGAGVLIGSLRDPNDDNESRARAAAGLGRIGSSAAVAALSAALDDFDLRVRQAAVAGLARAGAAALAELQRSESSPEPRRRALAAQALGGIGSPRAVGLLAAGLRDPDPGVRRAAARALAVCADPGAVGPLVTALGDPEAGDIAQGGLCRIGEPARAALVAALGSPNATAAYRAAQALAGQGPAAVSALRRRGDAGGQRWVLVALGGMGGGPEVASAARELCASPDPEVRRGARELLQRMGM